MRLRNLVEGIGLNPGAALPSPPSGRVRVAPGFAGAELGVFWRPGYRMEFYQGRPLEPEELEAIRQQIEQFDTIEAIDPEMRGIVERNWPHLVSKLPPETF
jgi:hypothetical protein